TARTTTGAASRTMCSPARTTAITECTIAASADRGRAESATGRGRDLSMSQPLSTRACGPRPTAGLLADGPTPPRLPVLPEAARWLRAARARRGGHPRSQWRVRAGFSPASLHRRPYEQLDATSRAAPRGQRTAARSALRAAEVAVDADVGQIRVEVAERRARVTELGGLCYQPAGVVEVVRAPEGERPLHNAVLQVEDRELALVG